MSWQGRRGLLDLAFLCSSVKSSRSMSARRPVAQTLRMNWSKRVLERAVLGWNSWSSSALMVPKVAGHSLGSRGEEEHMPCLRAFMAERDLPSLVRGPVLFLALARLAARRLGLKGSLRLGLEST